MVDNKAMILVGVNLLALLGLAICGAVMIKKGMNQKLLQASFGLSVTSLLLLLIHGAFASAFGRGGLLLLLLYLIFVYPLIATSVVLYAKKVSDSSKMRLVNSLKAMLFVSSGAGVLLLLYQQHLGVESTREKL